MHAVVCAGLVNNLNHGIPWSVFPRLFVANGVSLEGVGLAMSLTRPGAPRQEVGAGWNGERVGLTWSGQEA